MIHFHKQYLILFDYILITNWLSLKQNINVELEDTRLYVTKQNMNVELEDTRLYVTVGINTQDERRFKYRSVFNLYYGTKRLNMGIYFAIAFKLS